MAIRPCSQSEGIQLLSQARARAQQMHVREVGKSRLPRPSELGHSNGGTHHGVIGSCQDYPWVSGGQDTDTRRQKPYIYRRAEVDQAWLQYTRFLSCRRVWCNSTLDATNT